MYRELRPVLGVPEDQILRLNDEVGLHPAMGPLKTFWDEGKLAIFVGVGYPNPSYSHFRSMDIWHTCEPDKAAIDGWLGKVVADLDPNKENVLTGVNFGRGLPRALAKEGVPVASVGDLETYGLLTGIEREDQRKQALDVFGRMYGPAIGTGYAMDYIRRTGTEALTGADILSTAPSKYTSNVEYPGSMVGQYLRNIAQTHLAHFGTRVLYLTSPNNVFDTHSTQLMVLSSMWTDISNSVDTFFADLRDHGEADNVLLFMFSEFGRRVFDNGSGTDHGAAGVAFAVGDQVKGGIYGVYSSLELSELLDGGNLKPTMDFRQVYATIVEDSFGLDSVPIVGGNFEKVQFL